MKREWCGKITLKVSQGMSRGVWKNLEKAKANMSCDWEAASE